MKRRKVLTVLLLIFGTSGVFGKQRSNPSPDSYQVAAVADSIIFKRALESIQNRVPLTYNAEVQRFIDIYITRQKSRISQMLGLSQYYFPIYKKVFENRNVPEELKYISVIESSLNPQAVSHMGATGPWQFLYEVGKLYGLKISDLVDERKDPFLAANAAASHLLESYYMYDDWLVAIASYNCGRNNIKWAMEKAGGKGDYWSIRQYLPTETQNYVPAYIATVYVMNHYWKHNIEPGTTDLPFETETISVSSPVTFSAIASASNLTTEEIARLNPAYLQGGIYGSEEYPQRLVLPANRKPYFDLVNDVMNGQTVSDARLQAANNIFYKTRGAGVKGTSRTRSGDQVIMYRVQRGDTLSSIVAQFKGATEEEIIVINKLKDSSSVKTGMVLKIIGG
ncbi:membrane-bound lytic murein transglycosylase D [Arcticibacter pallidicorallinus]|uniref:Membrane-bound lytic murein transglycosylase D n=2 Tax=Arcticibacter pallidicorallinus TaxID=1259464 RepID=A0A2T0U6U9_9SPHI|nr:membrane-bound lytic murein transglycosylase D [Arcticibacter pallidicorallinus]